MWPSLSSHPLQPPPRPPPELRQSLQEAGCRGQPTSHGGGLESPARHPGPSSAWWERTVPPERSGLSFCRMRSAPAPNQAAWPPERLKSEQGRGRRGLHGITHVFLFLVPKRH